MLSLIRNLFRVRPAAFVAAGGVVIDIEMPESERLPAPLARMPTPPALKPLEEKAREFQKKLGYDRLATAIVENRYLEFLARHGVTPFDRKTVDAYKEKKRVAANKEAPLGVRYSWDTCSLSSYKGPVPIAILDKAMELKEAWEKDNSLEKDIRSPSIYFYVDSLQYVQYVEDPFLMVKFGTGGDYLYIAVWDEPGFGV